MITIDSARCQGCGLCATHCSEAVLTHDGQGTPRVGDLSHCLDCHHCVAACPSGAITHGRVAPTAVRYGDIGAETMENFLRAKRSCRHFQSRALTRAELARLVGVAATAPSSKNCEERAFTVITDPEVLAALRRDIVKSNRRLLRLLHLLTSRPLRWLLPRETAAALRRMIPSFVRCLARESEGHDAVFHQAPAVICIAGIAPDPFGKDNALAAQHYLMVLAEAMGLGTCIMGYAQANPRALARRLCLPRLYRIYAVIAVGWPAYRFHHAADRKPPRVQWMLAGPGGVDANVDAAQRTPPSRSEHRAPRTAAHCGPVED
ncbi:MAG: nitroreductase family protein [Polyangiaceae bacterium]|nr:nitroreductase family protein [Polyangiaceae bacterium]